MDSSWSHDSEKVFMLSNGAISPPNLLNPRTKNEFTNWGLKGFSYGYELNEMMISSHQNPVEKQRNFEVGSIRKRSSNDSMRNYLSNNGSGGDDLINMHSNTISGDDESSSRLTNSFVDSSSKESSLIDLKLGRFGDNLIIQNATISTAPVISSADSSTPAKRVKASALNSQPVYCQVYGCNKDLGSSKDYHKRHKVCDVHSKTAKVIVNGLEQRFCQQCSRFHLLGEFDDGKRSCRRRLAGHNERRRKPQVGAHSGRAGRLTHSYNGINTPCPNKTSMTATSFICQDISPKIITNNPHPKLRDGPDFECCWVDGQFLQKQPLYNSEMTANVLNGNSFNQYHHPHNIFDTESSGCALSLLSSQTQTSSGMPSSSSNPLMGNLGFSEVCQFGGSSNYQHLSSVALSNSNVVGSDFSGGFGDGGPSFNVEGATIDLLQLSSQLQRVEHHRQDASVKQEDETFCCLKIT